LDINFTLIFQAFIAVCCTISSDVQGLISYGTFFETMFIGLTVSSLIYMRKKYPELARPLKVKFTKKYTKLPL